MNFRQPWAANIAGLLGSSARKTLLWRVFRENGAEPHVERSGKPRRSVKEFAGCGWLKFARQTATRIVRYFLKQKKYTAYDTELKEKALEMLQTMKLADVSSALDISINTLSKWRQETDHLHNYSEGVEKG